MSSRQLMGALMVAVAVGSSRGALSAPIDRLVVVINGIEVPAARLLGVTVDQDIDQPDMALVTLSPPPRLTPAIGAAVNIAAPGAGANAVFFKGEIVSIEPSFDSGPGAVTLRAFNRLHRLSRARRSRVFEEQTDSDIVSAIAAEYGFTAAVSGGEAQIVHTRVAQHNQTDLEFLLARAALIGYEVFVDAKSVNFHPRADASPVTLDCPAQYKPSAVELRAFRARLATADQTQRVVVRGWDPVKERAFAGSAQGRTIDLAGTLGPAPRLIGGIVDLGSVRALSSPESAHGAAKGALAGLTVRDVAAEADVEGTPLVKPFGVVAVTGRGAAFDGKYHVVGVSHRYSHDGTEHTYSTLARLTRQDRAMYFFLPEVDDEVLVAFVHGDAAQPFVIGSLWNDRARPDERACDPRRE